LNAFKYCRKPRRPDSLKERTCAEQNLDDELRSFADIAANDEIRDGAAPAGAILIGLAARRGPSAA
jgi:hypothetical protein